MTIVNALKDFFSKLTGVEPSGSRIADVIRNGSTNITSDLSTVILNSSTEGSSKRFEITVNDEGTVSATEVV